jgi:hypothetical protein
MSLRTSARAVLISACLLGAALAAPSVRAQGASIESATPEQKKAAQDGFKKGASAQKKGQHEEALAAFKESYQAVASPNTHLMMARSLVELNRLEEAYVEYEKTLAEAKAAAGTDKKYQQTADQAEKELADVRGKIALLTIEVSGAGEGDRVTVRGRELDKNDWGKPIPVMPGSVRVELVTAAGKETVQEVNAEAGGSQSVTLAPPTAAAPPPPETEGHAEAKLDTSGGTSLRTWAYVAGGVGIAGLATFGVFGVMNNSKHSDLEEQCNNGVCPKSAEEDADTGRTYQTIANVGLVVGVVGLATGTVLFLMSGNKEEKAAQRTTRRAQAARWNVDVGPRWVGVRGSF